MDATHYTGPALTSARFLHAEAWLSSTLSSMKHVSVSCGAAGEAGFTTHKSIGVKSVCISGGLEEQPRIKEAAARTSLDQPHPLRSLEAFLTQVPAARPA